MLRRLAQRRAAPGLFVRAATLLFELAQDAAAKAVIPAIVNHRADLAVAILLDEEVLVQAQADVIPGHDLVHAAFASRIPIWVQPLLGKGLHPGAVAELIAPGVELGAELPGALDDIGQAAVAAAEVGFHEGFARVVPVEMETDSAQAVLQIGNLAAHGLFGLQRRPLEGRVRFGHQRADADAHLGLLAHDAAADAHHRPGQVGDGFHILIGLRGVADHEVHLDRRPAAAVNIFGGLEQVVGGDRLVDDITQAVGRGFGRKGEAAAPTSFLQQVHQVHRERFDAQAGQADAELVRAVLVHHRLDQLADVGVIAGAEREEGNFLEAAARDHLIHGVEHLLHRSLAHRAVGHARVTEAAAARTAALNFDRGAVVHHIQVRHDEIGRGRRQRGDDALGHHRRRHAGKFGPHRGGDQRAVGVIGGFVERRNVHARDGCHAAQQILARDRGRVGLARLFPGQLRAQDLQDDLFALADQKRVYERPHRLRVGARAAARQDQRIVRAAIGRAQGDAGQVEAVERVGEELLVGQAKADDIEITQGMARLQAEERHRFLAHERFHVHPGRVRAFGQHVRLAVDDVVEQHQAQVGHAEFVGVRKGQGQAHGDRVPVFGHAVVLAPGVARRLLHRPEDTIEARADARWGPGMHGSFSYVCPVKPGRGWYPLCSSYFCLQH